ncbi:ribonucleases P/MRP protein subunit POP1-domain-containing protein [Bombardia bombarda]|uniref:Ribonucleases P/MRP protein subunit POP1-domain-containing protein n=1 Tax=Bombardia bombarda TaxID=252184 RepID=A0AA39X8A8_9PEZI|nr:ribonucleases P/MRP protein subunit POP1-domain-containing protein [Bombardia bombarda]
MDGRKSASSGKASGATKRKEPPSGTGNARGGQGNNGQAKDGRPPNRAPKRVKFHDARNIRTQPSDAALEDGRLDLQRFLNAREFEIKALESSMRKCKAVNATRVFQQVPRAMRRRTASHNVKRIPKRLRERARKEQIDDKTPTIEARRRRPRTTRARIRAETAKKLGILAARKKKKMLDNTAEGAAGTSVQPTVETRAPRPKIRRNTLNQAPKIKSKFRKRQINKTWLPTHVWHAKRATMTEPSHPLWRFAIPLTPTQKCYRPIHRASGQKGAVAWDMSYMSTIGLYGSDEGAERVLRAIGLTQESIWGGRGRNWRAGARKWTGFLSKQRKEGRRDIGPATIIWNPEEEMDLTHPKKSQRQIFIRTHPSCFLELFQELLKLVKMQTPQLHVEDLRFEIGSIEITGPGSTETLLGIIQPYYDKPEAKENQARIFKSLDGVTNPASLPKDALLAFSAMDPRLGHPSKSNKSSTGSVSSTLLDTLTNWPIGENPKPYGLFSRDSRYAASKLPSLKSINRRKGTGLPGNGLRVTAVDPPIPVILFASRPATDGQAQGTWTLLAPWKCILPVWYSLMHYPLSSGGNPHLGGLEEQRQIAFEQGAPWFPVDFPGTEAGASWELEQREKRLRDWGRRPKGKRVEWRSLDLGAGRKGEIGDGLACDFEYLFRLPKDDAQKETGNCDASVPDPDAMQIDGIEYHEPREVSHSSLLMVQHMEKASFNALFSSANLGKAPAYSVITVQLTFVTRGIANVCARIYRLPTRAPTVIPPSTDTEVPATPLPSPGLPSDLRDHWLANLPLKSIHPNVGSSRGRQGRRQQQQATRQFLPGTNLAERKSLLARSLVTTSLPYPAPSATQKDIGGHPFCPSEEDLIGFVTSGSFSLSEGKGTAIGSISAERAFGALKGAGAKEGKLCVVRNAGESVGWLARWEAI